MMMSMMVGQVGWAQLKAGDAGRDVQACPTGHA
jgi:hypothetical protein